jgi:protein TonB
MGYQALLFCTNEKLARVVSQLFSELEFSVSAISDPFAAVKSLMAQHYDAVVIDCENEQSASLMLKSARNSPFNQGSLAIGLVEGQVGIAKAYRMGANLVLTKPINVEAAKGTLRVARGLLRKGTEANAGGQGVAAPATATAHPSSSSFASSSVGSTNQNAETRSASGASSRQNVAPQYRTGADISESSAPPAPYPMFAKSEPAPTLTPAVPMKPWTSIGSTVPVAQVAATPAQTNAPQAWAKPETPEMVAPKIEAPKPVVTPAVITSERSHGTAAAPAMAKIATPPQQPAYEEEKEFAEDEDPTTPAEFSAIGATIQGPSLQEPSFSMDTEHSSGSGGGQKIVIGAVAVLLLIGGYFGWTKFGQSNPAPAAVVTVPHMPTDAESGLSTPVPAQASTAPTNRSNVAVPTPGHTNPSMQPAHSPVITASAAQTPVTQAASNQPNVAKTPDLSESTGTKTSPSAILVKAGTGPGTHAQTQNQSEEASAQPPSPLAVAVPANSGLSDVLTSAAASAKPSLAKIKVSQGVLQGLLIKRVEPQYPRNALTTHTQGAVQIEATVDKEGRVVNPKVLSGPFMLAPAALDAVRQWRYKPYYLDGEPVEVQTQITINFKTQ